MSTRPETLTELAALIDPAAAQKFTAEVLATLGMATYWNADQFDAIALSLVKAAPDGLPRWHDQDEEDEDYWERMY